VIERGATQRLDVGACGERGLRRGDRNAVIERESAALAVAKIPGDHWRSCTAHACVDATSVAGSARPCSAMT
jgi:hypothetical protein